MSERQDVTEYPPDQIVDVRVCRKPKKTLSPEEAAVLIERLRVARVRQRELRVDRVKDLALITAEPLAHCDRVRRSEWEVIVRYLADPNLTLKQIAGMLGFKNWRTVQQTLARPHIKAIIAEIRAKQVEAIIKGDFGAQALLKQSQVKAAQKVVETIDNPAAGPKTNLAAAESVLDRTGLGKASAVQHHHVHEILRHFTADELAAYGTRGIVPERFATVFAQLEGPKASTED